MKDIEQLYALWDEFLKEWPARRLRTMTLDEYTQTGSNGGFAIWAASGAYGHRNLVFFRAQTMSQKKVMAGCAIAIRMPGIRLWAQRLKKLLKRCAIT